jgi:hypothetical protein
MEEQGIVGPAEDGGRSRQVLTDEYDLEEDEDDESV